MTGLRIDASRVASPGPAVSFDNVVKAFGAVEVLHGISFDLMPGRVVGLLGENGAGKKEKLPPKTIIPAVLITKGNAKEFCFPDSPF